MTVLTEVASTELVIPVEPTTVHRTVEYRGENNWVVQGWSSTFSAAFAALLAIREEVEREARHPVRINIRWKNVPAKFIPPQTGTTL